MRQSTTRDITLSTINSLTLLIDCFSRWCYICPSGNIGILFFLTYKAVIGFRSLERLGWPIEIDLHPSLFVVVRHDSCPNRGARGRVKVVKIWNFFKNFLHPLIWKKSWAHCNVNQKEFYQNYYFMSPAGIGVLTFGRSQNGLIVIMHVMFKNLLYFCWYWMELTVDKEKKIILPFTKIVNFKCP